MIIYEGGKYWNPIIINTWDQDPWNRNENYKLGD
jgi:hypothetical protein